MPVETKVEFYTKKRAQRLGNLGTLLKQNVLLNYVAQIYGKKAKLRLVMLLDSMAQNVNVYEIIGNLVVCCVYVFACQRNSSGKSSI